ncbi:MAG: hypothetical protein A2754_00380 [Candidatus Magasanikbacteria bacterium RIFCSPHIGHO2_01_FULL_47_8]|uniref:Uncharacterized protein n=1 Tax=Candidatus Magasanikbacteria bacterium RIFCSPHIGHO2_01_FULL_47_8 TaxID=1798673 RepID=A0A1F6MDN9_9BACT|nr:MAG: hypothetical protein A2754_00380 [Candidatus Magasanikbacteria bacterium RIFCSPHIGHO2_01_FULL_47_8]
MPKTPRMPPEVAKLLLAESKAETLIRHEVRKTFLQEICKKKALLREAKLRSKQVCLKSWRKLKREL